jgi:hypothetical protein
VDEPAIDILSLTTSATNVARSLVECNETHTQKAAFPRKDVLSDDNEDDDARRRAFLRPKDSPNVPCCVLLSRFRPAGIQSGPVRSSPVDIHGGGGRSCGRRGTESLGRDRTTRQTTTRDTTTVSRRRRLRSARGPRFDDFDGGPDDRAVC